MTITSHLEIPLGDTWHSKRWALVVGGEVIDLTDGWTVRAQVRAPFMGGTSVLHEWTTEDGGVELGTAEFEVAGTPVTGATMRLRIGASESQSMAEWYGVWDLEVSHPTFDNGELWRKTLVSGSARARADVTR